MEDNYEFMTNIGQGMSGQVYKARNKKENKIYAIKKLNFNEINEKEKIAIQDEVNLLKQLKHPNIVSYKDSFFDKENNLNIVMVFCEGGDMYTKIRKQKGEHFEEEQILTWIAQLCLALSYVHDKQILHRDIKTQNIFIQNEKTVRIGDFGIAKGYNQSQNLGGSLIGTPLYMAPEVYNSSKKYSFRSDIWSLGCCIFEMCNLKNAFEAKSWNAVFVKVNKGQRANLNSKYSSDMKNLVDSMLNVKSINRPTIASILEKPFMKPVVGKYISDFIQNAKEYGADEEQITILKEQAEKFCIFNVNMSNELFGGEYESKLKNKDKEDLKDINENEKKVLLDKRKELEIKLKDLENEKIKILENRKKTKRNLNAVNNNIYAGNSGGFANHMKSRSINKDESKIKYNSLEKKIPNNNNVNNNSGHKNNNNIPDGYNRKHMNNIFQKYNTNDEKEKRSNSKGVNNNHKLGHQNSDYKLSGIDAFQETNNNNESRPLTSKKSGGSKEAIRLTREEKKLNVAERNRLTKIIQEIGRLKKEIEQIDNKAISFNQYNINNDNFYNENSVINNINGTFTNIDGSNNLTKNGTLNQFEEDPDENNEKENEEEIIERKNKIEKIMNNPQNFILERINFYKNRCMNSIGKKIYLKAYEYVKSLKMSKSNNIDYNLVREQLSGILGKNNIGFWQMIEQILILEELLNKQNN